MTVTFALGIHNFEFGPPQGTEGDIVPGPCGMEDFVFSGRHLAVICISISFSKIHHSPPIRCRKPPFSLHWPMFCRFRREFLTIVTLLVPANEALHFPGERKMERNLCHLRMLATVDLGTPRYNVSTDTKIMVMCSAGGCISLTPMKPRSCCLALGERFEGDVPHRGCRARDICTGALIGGNPPNSSAKVLLLMPNR